MFVVAAALGPYARLDPRTGCVYADPDTGRCSWKDQDQDRASSPPPVWCGGDATGRAETTVESANDGKTAAYYMHAYLRVSAYF